MRDFLQLSHSKPLPKSLFLQILKNPPTRFGTRWSATWGGNTGCLSAAIFGKQGNGKSLEECISPSVGCWSGSLSADLPPCPEVVSYSFLCGRVGFSFQVSQES